MLTNDEIREHPLLDDEFRAIAKALCSAARKRKDPFPSDQLADVMLRGAARTYAEASEREERAPGSGLSMTEHTAHRELRRAALLYAYEALRTCDSAMISEYPELENVLDLFRWLALEVL